MADETAAEATTPRPYVPWAGAKTYARYPLKRGTTRLIPGLTSQAADIMVLLVEAKHHDRAEPDDDDEDVTYSVSAAPILLPAEDQGEAVPQEDLERLRARAKEIREKILRHQQAMTKTGF